MPENNELCLPYRVEVEILKQNIVLAEQTFCGIKFKKALER